MIFKNDREARNYVEMFKGIIPVNYEILRFRERYAKPKNSFVDIFEIYDHTTKKVCFLHVDDECSITKLEVCS